MTWTCPRGKLWTFLLKASEKLMWEIEKDRVYKDFEDDFEDLIKIIKVQTSLSRLVVDLTWYRIYPKHANLPAIASSEIDFLYISIHISIT